MTTPAPNTSGFILNAGDSGDLPNSRVIAVDQGLGLVDDGTFITITPEEMLGALQDLSSTGFVCRTASNTLETRTLTSTGSIQFTYPDGIGGNPVISLVPLSSQQLIQVFSAGIPVGGPVGGISFLGGTNIGISCMPSGESVQVTISANGGGGGGGAPVDAFYLTTKANSDLTNDVNLGALSSGYLYGTTADGVSTISSVATIPVNQGGTGATTANAAFNALCSPATFYVDNNNNFGFGTNISSFGSSSTNDAYFGQGVFFNAVNVTYNTGIGAGAGYWLTSGNNNTLVGAVTGANSSAIVSLSNSACVGAFSGPTVSGLTNVSTLGYQAQASTSNTLVLGQPQTSVVIGSTAPGWNSPYALTISNNPANFDNSILLNTTLSPIALGGSSGGNIYVDSSNALQYVSGTSTNSGQVVVANNTPSTNNVISWNGTSAVWATGGGGGTTVYSGQATLGPVDGVAQVTVGSQSNVGYGSIIVVSYDGPSNPGVLFINSIQPATSFIIESTNPLDTSTVNWFYIA